MTSPSDRSFPYPLGISLRDGRANFAIYSATADKIEFCVFDDNGAETRTELRDRTGHVFHGLIDDVGPGTRYALRVHGEWNPAAGLRHNPNKLLLDPHATAVLGSYTWGQPVFAHDLNHPDELDPSDGAGSTPLCVITADDFDWGDDAHPVTALEDTVVYEVH